MSLYTVRKKSLTLETIHHDGGPTPERPLRVGAATAVVSNPYAGHYEEDLLPFMTELRELGTELSTELVDAFGGPAEIETYGKGAIVGVDGEIEHAAVWHEAGGWAMRQVLEDPKAMVASAQAVGTAGYRLMVPMHYIHASYVRSHYSGMEIGLQDSPRPAEILFAVVMGDGGRPHSRLGGLTKDKVTVHDGQR